MKVKAIIKRALQLINAVEQGADPTADQYADALAFFNDMLTGQDGLMLNYISREEFSTVASQRVYTIGSGGDFNTAKPVSIDSAYITDGGVEWPVKVVPRNLYDRKTIKTTESRPYILYYDPYHPLGKIYLYYVPEKVYTLRLNLKKELVEYTSINDDFLLPNQYRRWSVFNLAVEYADVEGFSVPNGVARIAKKAEKVIKRINLNNNIDDAELDNGLLGGRIADQRGAFYGGFSS
jgi:hypothetical protein